MGTGNALAVMLKAPEPGFVKTRLVPPLSYGQAALLYECLIRDTFGKLAALEGVDVFGAYTPAGAEDRIKGMAPGGTLFFPQEGADLGERMFNVFMRLFGLCYKRAVIIGSDIPDLPPGRVAEAFRALEAGEGLVLGPADDGGYYLIGADAPHEPLFRGIDWSTERVLGQTMERAKESGLGIRLLEAWHDIDDIKDLRLLKDSTEAPRSARFLRDSGISF